MGLVRARLLADAAARAMLVIGVLVTGLLSAVPAQAPPTSGDAAVSPVKVRFLEPGAALLEGTIRITVEASTSADASIASVSVFADDRLLTTKHKMALDHGRKFTTIAILGRVHQTPILHGLAGCQATGMGGSHGPQAITQGAPWLSTHYPISTNIANSGWPPFSS